MKEIGKYSQRAWRDGYQTGGRDMLNKIYVTLTERELISAEALTEVLYSKKLLKI